MSKREKKKKHRKPLDVNPAKNSSFSRLLDQITSFEENSSKDQIYKKYFIYSAILILFLMFGFAMNTGINGDDYFQDSYSDKITSFYTSFGKDTSCFFHPAGPIQYYGGLFEIITGSINQVTGNDIYDPSYHHIRHFINALFGFACILFLGFWLRNSGGWLLATMGIWLLFFSPRFIGHAAMNPKDIPFAAGYIISIYFLSKLLREFPAFKIRSLIGLSIGLGVAIGIRIGGLVLFGYIALFLGLKIIKYLLGKQKQNYSQLVYKPVKLTLLSLAFGFGLGLFFWPYGLIDPFSHIPEALQKFNDLAVGINILFRGIDIFGDQAPWYYHPLWIIKTVPFTILFGLILISSHIKSWKEYGGLQDILIAVFAFAFPIIYIFIKSSAQFDGWRHIIFIYPSLVFLATCGWYIVFKKYWNNETVRYALIGVLALSILEAGVFMGRNIQYPHVYFNPIGGGIKGAQGWYDIDYWGTSAEEAAKWMVNNDIISKDQKDSLIIASNFIYPVSTQIPKQPNIKLKYTKYQDRNLLHWDYGIFVCRYIPGIQLREGIWPPSSQEIHAIIVNGVKLAVVLKNEDDAIYRAGQYIQLGKNNEAISILENKAKSHPQDETIWYDLGFAYQNINDLKSAEKALKNALLINPHSLYANNYLAINYLMEGREEEGIEQFNKSLEFSSINYVAHFYLASIYADNGNLDSALSHGLKAIEINGGFKPAYILVADIYKSLGDTAASQQYMTASENLTSGN